LLIIFPFIAGNSNESSLCIKSIFKAVSWYKSQLSRYSSPFHLRTETNPVSKSFISNCKQISSSGFSNLFETVIYDFFTCNNILVEKQFLVLSKTVTLANLLTCELVKYYRSFSSRIYVAGIFCNLDCVNCEILAPLHYGMNGISSKWLATYLENRRQRVVAETSKRCVLIVFYSELYQGWCD
jgi:hypothetical protein